MDSFELLVHITAPGTVRDDRRYRAIAQAVCDFEPATLMKLNLNGHGNDEDTEVPVFMSPDSSMNSSHPTTSVIAETPAVRPPSKAVYANLKLVIESTISAKQALANKPRKPAGATRLPTSTANPPYRNPFHGLNWANATAQTRLMKTPELQRPKTAPAASTPSLLVPFTDNVLRKRAYSESSASSSFTSAIAETQPLLTAAVSSTLGVSFTERISSSQPNSSSDGRGLITSSPNAQTLTRPTKRRRLSVDAEDGMGMQAVVEDVTGEVEGPFFLRDRELDWSSSPRPASSAPSTSSIPSTLSPSQSILPTTFSAAAMQKKKSPIDLTSPYVNTANGSNHRGTRPSPSPGSRPQAKLTGRKGPETMPTIEGPSRTPTTAKQIVSIVSNLPAEINPPPPPTSSDVFRTHITRGLDSITDRLALANHFQPEYVRRDVKVLERGYWRLRITIATDAVVWEARKSPSKAELLEAREKELAGSSVAERLGKWRVSRETDGSEDVPAASQIQRRRATGLWTETEFRSFWKNLTSYIEAGKAGWGVRAIKEVVQNSEHTESDDGELRLTIRVFTWGEVVGHVWLVMWVLSDKSVSFIPMEWVSGDETVVVRMTGDRYRQGTLEPWTRKGPEGEKGLWGVSR